MKVWALVTVNLKGAGEMARKRFAKYMDGEDWENLEDIPNAWISDFEEDISADEAETIALDDVDEAASAAGIEDFSAGVLVSKRAPKVLEP